MAAVFAFWARLGRAPAMRERVWVGVRGGEQFAWAAFEGRGVLGLGFRGCVQGVCVVHLAGWVGRGVWDSPRRVCVGCWVWGAVRGVRREGLLRAFVVVWAGGGAPCRGARGCAQWWACVGHRVGSGEGWAGAGVVCGDVGLGSRVLCWRMCRLAVARLCVHL